MVISLDFKSWKQCEEASNSELGLVWYHGSGGGGGGVGCAVTFCGIFYGYITNSQSGQLPVGVIAQLVEHCTGIAEVMGSNPVQA